MEDSLEDYDDIEMKSFESSDNTKAIFQKFQNKIDFNYKSCERNRDKSDRATTNHALDRRSCSILYKMMSQGTFFEINGCISTGKEANVYHAVGPHGDMAIKLYMTSILPFKSRNKYVTGDFRMRHNYSTCSSWKLVSKWAEKEFRNLIRINTAQSIPAPTPLKLKGVVLLMTMIGKDGYPAPKLKDVAAGEWEDFGPPPDWPLLYRQILNDVRTLYQKCRLVHADLSEYNMLYMDGKAWMIDVSQAVEHEAPRALDFLRDDCFNVNNFFRRQGVATLTLREFFEWVVDPSLPHPDETAQCSAYLDKLLARATERGHNSTLDAEDDAFRRVYVPRSLFEVRQFFRDFVRLKKGLIKPEDLYYAAVSGIRSALPGGTPAKVDGPTAVSPAEEGKDSKSETESSSAEEDGASDASADAEKCFEEERIKQSNRHPRNESPESKRLRKKEVREEKVRKRETKIPKKVKKRCVKAKK
uniref:Serine/threonine-protein kinase RIO1 n=1 Tax=Schistocephalus solidus TaxID=70667 RepID=A0A0X3P3A4_SCHSO